MDARQKASKAYLLLKKNYPDSKTQLDYTAPIDMLVATILSAQCTDARVNTVTKTLFRKYKTPKDYAEAKQEELEQDIKSTGFYRNKAKNIIAAAKLILKKHRGKVPDSMGELIQLPGVARKTANIVLWNAYGKIGGIAVDTHVQRVSYRIGLTRNTEPAKIEQDLMKLFPEREWPHVTNYIISHGRATCQAKKPNCKECFLYNLCEKRGVESRFWAR